MTTIGNIGALSSPSIDIEKEINPFSSVAIKIESPHSNELAELERDERIPLRIELLKKRFFKALEEQIARDEQTLKFEFVRAIKEHNLEGVSHALRSRPTLVTEITLITKEKDLTMLELATSIEDPMIEESGKIVKLLKAMSHIEA